MTIRATAPSPMGGSYALSTYQDALMLWDGGLEAGFRRWSDRIDNLGAVI